MNEQKLKTVYVSNNNFIQNIINNLLKNNIQDDNICIKLKEKVNELSIPSELMNEEVLSFLSKFECNVENLVDLLELYSEILKFYREDKPIIKEVVIEDYTEIMNKKQILLNTIDDLDVKINKLREEELTNEQQIRFTQLINQFETMLNEFEIDKMKESVDKELKRVFDELSMKFISQTNIFDYIQEYLDRNIIIPLASLREEILGLVRIFVRVNYFTSIQGKSISRMTPIELDRLNVPSGYQLLVQSSRELIQTNETKTIINIDFPSDVNLEYCENIFDKKEFGKFFKVYITKELENTNQEIFYGTLYRNLECVEDGFCQSLVDLFVGKSVNIFTYGYSGSGKTYTLFGDYHNVEGLVQLSLNYLNTLGVEIELSSIRELYGFINSKSLANYFTIGKLGNILYNSNSDFNENEQQFIISHQLNRNISPIQMITNINDIRIRENRIKATMNNPESSRSHMFITFNIRYNNIESKLTFVDLAGVENPIDILLTEYRLPKSNNRKDNDILFSDNIDKRKLDAKSILFGILYGFGININNDYIMSFKYLTRFPDFETQTARPDNAKVMSWFSQSLRRHEFLSKREKEEYKEQIQRDNLNTRRIVQEGFFINDTLQKLKVFLLHKSRMTYDNIMNRIELNKYRQNHDLAKYNPITYFYSDDLPIVNNEIQTKTDKTRMFDILKDLDNNGQSKFMLFMNIRTEMIPNYCDSIYSTLQFAESISSLN
jgi:hypothetical protein